MLEAAKFGDPVLGVDVHMVLVPAPPAPAPIPTPLPHPFVGVVFDPLGAALGAALGLAFGGGGPVLINYMPCGNTGTDVKGVPHFPTPPGVSFAPNDIPSNDGTLVFGSKTVSMAGSSIARLTDLVMTCNFPINLPTSVCMAVPMGAPVLVGGPPSLDILAAVTKAIRTKWFSDALHKITGGRFSKIICFLTGHPVDVMTGEVLTDPVDFELPGPLPLKFERNYHSRSTGVGALGMAWSHSLDLWAHEEDWRLVVRLADGRERWHPRIPVGMSVWDDVDRYTLERTARGYALTTAEGVTYSFAAVEGARATHPLARVSDRLGRAIELRYARGRLDVATDSAGRALRFQHDAEGRLTSVRVQRHGERGAWWMELARYEYDAEGRLCAAFDAMGSPYRYEYRDGVLVKETNRDGLNFHFEYDWDHPEGWCTRTWGDGGIYDRRITYDKHRHVTLVDDSRGGREHYFGNAAGLVTKRIDPTGGVWKYEYDALSRRVAEEDPIGNRTERAYDRHGNKTLERDALGAETRWTYNAWNLPVSTQDAAGCAWSREYNNAGLLRAAVDPLGGRYTYDHDRAGRLSSATDPAGRTLAFGYNDAGDLVAATDADGHTTRYEVDDLGRVVGVVDRAGRATRITRDACGRVTEVLRADGSTRRVDYDGEGNPVRATDEQGRTTRCRYAGLNRLVERVEPDGATVRYEYDTEEALVAVVNARGERHRIARDLAGRIVREDGFDGRALVYRYDRAGRCEATVDGRGRTTRVERDGCGQIVGRCGPDGQEARYAYDPLGRLVGALNADCALSRELDPLGRVTREALGDTVIERRYGPAGNWEELTSSLGLRVARESDGGGRLRSAVIYTPDGARAKAIRIERDGAGRETARHLPGGVTARWDYLDAERAERRRVFRGDVEVKAESYVRRPGGGIARKIDPERGPTEFEHDTRGRLVAMRRADGFTQHRAPDAAGDVHRTPDRSDREYGPGGVVRAAGGVRYVHDADGQLTERVLPDGARWRYEWDALGQLRAVKHPDGTAVTFAYDALGRRVGKTVEGRSTAYVWEGDDLLHEVEAGGVTVTWVNDPGRYAPLAKLEGARLYSAAPDPLGAPAALYDEAGELAWSAQLDLFGVAETDVARTSCPWRWPGQYEDPETGLYYNRYRYYDPSLGRYLSQDPIGLAGGLALYAYTDDPLRWVDPLGLAGCTPAGRELTEHAEESLRRHGFREPFGHVDNIIDNATRRVTQEDGAIVNILRNAGRGRSYDIVIESEGRIVTGMRNLTSHELNNLANNYGWVPWPAW